MSRYFVQKVYGKRFSGVDPENKGEEKYFKKCMQSMCKSCHFYSKIIKFGIISTHLKLFEGQEHFWCGLVGEGNSPKLNYTFWRWALCGRGYVRC